jgi:hypothetical protein
VASPFHLGGRLASDGIQPSRLLSQGLRLAKHIRGVCSRFCLAAYPENTSNDGMRGFKYSVTKAFSNRLRHQMQHGSRSGASGDGWSSFVKLVNGWAGYNEDAALHATQVDSEPEPRNWVERLVNVALTIVVWSWFLFVWSAVICVLGALICVPIAILATGDVFLVVLVACIVLGFCTHGK